MTFNVGDIVTVSHWFASAFPGEYTIESIKEDGTRTITGGVDFAPEHLTKVN